MRVFFVPFLEDRMLSSGGLRNKPRLGAALQVLWAVLLVYKKHGLDLQLLKTKIMPNPWP